MLPVAGVLARIVAGLSTGPEPLQLTSLVFFERVAETPGVVVCLPGPYKYAKSWPCAFFRVLGHEII